MKSKTRQSTNNTPQFVLFFAMGLLPLAANAASASWDGDTDGTWTTSTNWAGDVAAPGTGTGEVATFNGAGGGNTTLELDGVTIFDIKVNSGAAAYTFGAGAIGDDTLTLEAGGSLFLGNGLSNNQTFNANVVLSDSGSVVDLQNNGSAAALIIAGDISIAAGSSSNAWLRFRGAGDVIINDVDTTNSTGTFLLESRAGHGIVNGTVNGGNTLIQLAGSEITTGAAGVLGAGTLQVRQGDLNLNNTTANQAFSSVTIGHATLGNGTATITMASGAGIDLNGNITYVDDSVVANTGLITGGEIQLTATRTVTVDDNTGVAGPELTIASDIHSSGDSFDLTKQGTGTLRLTGTNNSTNNGINRTRLREGVLQIESQTNLGDLQTRVSNGTTAAVLEYVGAGGTVGNIWHSGTGTTNATIRANGTGAADFNDFRDNGTGTVTTLDGSSTANNLISDDLGEWADTSLTKAGTGTWVISAANTYTGSTTVSGGILSIASTGAINSTSGVSIGSGEFNFSSSTALTQAVRFSGAGGTLSGTGTIDLAVDVTSGNTLSTGDSNIGTMNFGSDLTAGGTYLSELFGGTSNADLANVAGNLDLTGGILDLVQLGTYTTGQKFTLFAYDGSLTGTFTDTLFTTIADDTTFIDGGGIWLLDYNDTTAGLNGGIGNAYVTVTAVPEPAAALLGSLGMLLLLRRRRA